MAGVTVSICDCCGADGVVRTSTVSSDAGESEGVASRKTATTSFVGADGIKRHLPDEWWIFELTTFGDKHIVAEVCGGCAKKLAKLVQRASKRLGDGATRARESLKALPAPKPKALKGKQAPPRPKKKR